jgi:branched-chain amino acid transport system substrate-binding protein
MIRHIDLTGGVGKPGRAGLGRRGLLAGAAAGVLAMPYVARGQAKAVKIGMQTILSGPIALLGTSQRNSVTMEVDRINAAGGLAGRQIELVVRDSRGQPQEAARVARELINSDGVEILIDAEASSGAFAVQEVIRDLGTLCLHTASETSSLTADPKLRVATAFRCARQGVHDAIVGGSYSAAVAKAAKLTKWATCSPDYAYGRDVTKQYLAWIKHFMPELEVITEAWPKLGTPDFTEVITKLLQARPQAVFSLLYAGDLSAFVNQASVYALFGQTSLFTPNMGDYPVLQAIKQLPAGIRTGDRYLETFPDTPANKAWGEAYRARFKDLPTNWAWQAATAVKFLEAAAKKAGSLETKAMAEALTGLKIDCPFGADGTVTMREDHTIVNYAIGWGVSQAAAPYIVDIKAGDWGQIFELEAEWKKTSGYA